MKGGLQCGKTLIIQISHVKLSMIRLEYHVVGCKTKGCYCRYCPVYAKIQSKPIQFILKRSRTHPNRSILSTLENELKLTPQIRKLTMNSINTTFHFIKQTNKGICWIACNLNKQIYIFVEMDTSVRLRKKIIINFFFNILNSVKCCYKCW